MYIALICGAACALRERQRELQLVLVQVLLHAKPALGCCHKSSF